MRILNVISLYPPFTIGGAERGTHNLAQSWVESGHEVHTLALRSPVCNTSDKVDGVHVERIAMANLYWPFGSEKEANPIKRLLWHTIDTHNTTMVQRVIEKVRRIAPDVILTGNLQGFSTAIVPALKSLGIPIVHVLHDLSLICVRTALYRGNQACEGHQKRCLDCRLLTAPRHRHLQAVDGVIGVSRYILDMHLEHGLFVGKPNFVIHNALRRDITPRAGIPSRNPARPIRLGFIGRVHPAKGIETILTALTDLKAQGQRFEFHVGGEGERAYVESLAARWPMTEVVYCGHVDPQSFLQGIDVLVFTPDSTEAFGNVVLEAFSQGIPVICSDCGGPTELVRHRSNGLIVPRANANALRDALLAMAGDCNLWKRCAKGALRSADKHQPWHTANTYLEVIEHINSVSV